jgi:hypothetical protein
MAIRSMIILFVEIRGLKLRIATIRGIHLNVELTSRVPMFDVSFLFDARLLRRKTDTRQIVSA